MKRREDIRKRAVVQAGARPTAARKQEEGRVEGQLGCLPAALSSGASLPPQTEEDWLRAHRLIR